MLSRIRWTFSPHYFLLHPLIPAPLLPYSVNIPPLLPFRVALSSALHILSCLLHGSRHLSSLLQSSRGLPPSSLTSYSPPDSFQCLSTYSCPLDDLPKPGQFVTICLTHSHVFRTYNCPLDVLLIHAQLITIRAIHCHAFPAHRLAHYYFLTIPDPFSTRNLI